MSTYFPFTIDFETTGQDAKTAHPIEAALATPEDGAYGYETFIALPEGVKIPPETSAVHHIIDEDLICAPDWATVVDALWGTVSLDELEPEQVVMVAHNAEYEKTILRGTVFDRASWVCTYKCALVAWPAAPSHSNEGLRYWLGFGTGRRSKQATHSALHDCKVTAGIFNKLYAWFYADLCGKGELDTAVPIHSDTAREAIIRKMIAISREIAQLPTCPIGKERGKKWDDVETGFLQWCLKQSDMRDDVIHAAKAALDRRGAPHYARGRY